MNEQKQLLYLTNLEAQAMQIPTLRAVTAKWKEEDRTACISFYFDGEPSEEDIEKASDACGQIIASYPDGLLEENYIKWDYPKPLPDQPFLAYKRAESSV